MSLKNFMRDKNFRDLFLFGRVLSAALIVSGYAFLGVWLSDWLAKRDVNILLSLCAIPLIAGFGMWQAWLFITKGRKK